MCKKLAVILDHEDAKLKIISQVDKKKEQAKSLI